MKQIEKKGDSSLERYVCVDIDRQWLSNGNFLCNENVYEIFNDIGP